MKIVRNIDFEKSLSLEYFQMFAMMIQDPCYQVRATVIEKLIDRLGRCELHFRYLNVLLLTVFEPETELKIKVLSILLFNSLHLICNTTFVAGQIISCSSV